MYIVDFHDVNNLQCILQYYSLPAEELYALSLLQEELHRFLTMKSLQYHFSRRTHGEKNAMTHFHGTTTKAIVFPLFCVHVII